MAKWVVYVPSGWTSADSVLSRSSYRPQNEYKLFTHIALTDWFSGAFVKLCIVLISFIVSVYPLVGQHGATQISLEGFSWKVIFGEFRKFVDKIQVSLTADKNDGYFNEDACALMIITHWILLIMRNVSRKSCIEHPNTHFIFNNSFCGV